MTVGCVKTGCVLLAVSLLVSGCQVGPAFRRPALPAPNIWDAASETADHQWPGSNWWTNFGSRQLDDLVARAQLQNLDIEAAQARIEQADGQLRVAGSALVPSIGVSPSGQAARKIGLTGHERHYAAGGGVLQAAYEVDLWGKNRSAREAAAASSEAARFDAQAVQIAIVSSIVATYVDLLGSKREAEVVQSNLARETRILDGMKELTRAGLTPQLDVSEQDVIVRSLAATLPPLYRQTEHLHTALAILLGTIPEDLELKPEELADLSVPAVVTGLPSGLLSRRPDVQKAEATLREANANIRVARANFFPSLNLTASGGVESYALTHYTVPPLGIYSLAASLSQPLFEGGRLQGQMKSAKGIYAEAIAQYRKSAIAAFGDVENALVDANELALQEKAEAFAVASATQSAQMAQAAYKGGSTTVLSELSGEQALLVAEQNEISTRVDHLKAIVALYQALGGGWNNTYKDI